MCEPIVLIHIHGDGRYDVNYLVHGETRVLVVDERSPHDRVYEITRRVAAEQIEEVVGESPIGNQFDARHEAVKARFFNIPLRVIE
jgi:hypothetical protein